MNAWLQSMGLDGIKPLLTALLLPPVPWLLMIVLGGWWLRRRPWLGGVLMTLGVTLVWACSTEVAADGLSRWLLSPATTLQDPQALRQSHSPRGTTLIVVLGGGRTSMAEYPEPTLNALSLERLRYGIWLSRETGFDLAFSGGIAPGWVDGPSEGAIAIRIARDEFRHPLRWAEVQSRDTYENARFTMELLRKQPAVGRLILVTHDLHMPRAMGHFQRARDAAGLQLDIVPAPVGIVRRGPERILGDFMPSPSGIARCRYAIREWLGLLARA